MAQVNEEVVQIEDFVDCMSLTDVETCVSFNDEFHPKRHSEHLKCLWCHSHHSGMDTHCQSLEAIRANPETYRSWICDHVIPYDTPALHLQRAHPDSPSKKTKKDNPHSARHKRVTRLLDTTSGDVDPLAVEDPYSSKSNSKSKNNSKSKSNSNKNSSSSNKSSSSSDSKSSANSNPGIMPNSYTAYSGAVQQFVAQAPKPVQFLGGLAMGVLGTIPFSPTKAIADVDSVANDIKSLVQNFSLQPSGYIKDITMIADTVKDSYSLFKDSGAEEVAEDATKVVAEADNPLGWLVGAGELALNGANVYYDVKTAIQAAKDGDEFTLGKSVGSILSLLAE